MLIRDNTKKIRESHGAFSTLQNSLQFESKSLGFIGALETPST